MELQLQGWNPCSHCQPVFAASTGLTQRIQLSLLFHVFSNVKQTWIPYSRSVLLLLLLYNLSLYDNLNQNVTLHQRLEDSLVSVVKNELKWVQKAVSTECFLRPWLEVEDEVQMGSCRKMIQEVILQFLMTNKDLAGCGTSSKRDLTCIINFALFVSQEICYLILLF